MATTTATVRGSQSAHPFDIQANKTVPVMNISPQSSSLRQPSPVSSSQASRPHMHHQASINVDKYFPQPHDTEKHSKLPLFMRMYGSITPRILVSLCFVAVWATLISCISHFWYPLVVSNVLLTVLGFVIGLAISFRTSSGYERYVDGRKYWAQLSQTSRDLARHIWIHAQERHDQDPELGKADLLAKLTALNLIVAYARALKHRLRFEPYANYDDLDTLLDHINTYAGSASSPDLATPPRKTPWKRLGEYLDLTIAQSNPRKTINRSTKQLGNLPLEILCYLSAYIERIIQNKTFDNGAHQGTVMGNLQSLAEVLAGTERVLNTPLPSAYTIAISQITWVYILALPFQLWAPLKWITIPGTVVAAYVILGIAAIGREIEDPFGHDANDLPLTIYCDRLAEDVSIISSRPPPQMAGGWIECEDNRVLMERGYAEWAGMSTEEIRSALRRRGESGVRARKEVVVAKQEV